MRMPSIVPAAAGLILAAPMLWFVPGAATAAPLTCDGVVATIVDSPGDDVIRGTNRRDVIVIGLGHDIVFGNGGPDLICDGSGESSDDVFYGGAGADVILGGHGHDVFRGGNGADVIHGGFFGDVIHGGAGPDLLYGEYGADLLLGGAGDDRLEGNVGQDCCEDFYYANALDGGAGDDEIVGFDDPTRDPYHRDMLAYIDNPGPVTVDLTAGTSSGAGNDHFTNVGGVIGSPYDDTITGTDGPNLLTGNGGSDRIIALAGDDLVAGDTCLGPARFGSVLWCTDATVPLAGVAGDDVLYGNQGGDAIMDGAGDDVVRAGPGAFIFAYAGGGHDSLSSGASNGILFLSFLAGPATANLTTGTVTGPHISATVSGFVEVWGTTSDDTLIGNAQDNGLYGGEGIDTIDGRAGTDDCSGEFVINCES